LLFVGRLLFLLARLIVWLAGSVFLLAGTLFSRRDRLSLSAGAPVFLTRIPISPIVSAFSLRRTCFLPHDTWSITSFQVVSRRSSRLRPATRSTIPIAVAIPRRYFEKRKQGTGLDRAFHRD